jgi:hypothetical protein
MIMQKVFVFGTLTFRSLHENHHLTFNMGIVHEHLFPQATPKRNSETRSNKTGRMCDTLVQDLGYR